MLALAVALLLAVPEDARFEAALAAGRVAWAARGDPARLAEAVARFGEAAALHPGDPQAELPLARAEAFRAEAAPLEAERAWLETMRAAERALRRAAPAWAEAIDRGEEADLAAERVGPSGAEALYLWALGAAGLARLRGPAAILTAGRTVGAALERAAKVAPRLAAGGPHRALGAWLAVLPSAAGGGAGRARAAFAKAREIAPGAQLTPLREAESLAVLLQDRAMFERLLGEVLASDPARAPDLAPENELAKRLARELLARRDRLF